jgi:hypothetical protein
MNRELETADGNRSQIPALRSLARSRVWISQQCCEPQNATSYAAWWRDARHWAAALTRRKPERTMHMAITSKGTSPALLVVAANLGKHRAGGAHDQQDAAHVLLDGRGCASPTVLMGGLMYKTIRGWILLLVACVLGIIWLAWDSPIVIPIALVGSLCLFRGVYDLEKAKSWPFNRTWWTGKRGAG